MGAENEHFVQIRAYLNRILDFHPSLAALFEPDEDRPLGSVDDLIDHVSSGYPEPEQGLRTLVTVLANANRIQPYPALKLRLLIEISPAAFAQHRDWILDVRSPLDLGIPARPASHIKSLWDLLRKLEDGQIINLTPGQADLDKLIRLAKKLSAPAQLLADLRTLEQDLGPPVAPGPAGGQDDGADFVTDVAPATVEAIHGILSPLGSKSTRKLLKYLHREVSPRLPSALAERLRIQQGVIDVMQANHVSSLDMLNEGIGIFRDLILEHREALLGVGLEHVDINAVIARIAESPDYFVVPNRNLANVVRAMAGLDQEEEEEQQGAIGHEGQP